MSRNKIDDYHKLYLIHSVRWIEPRSFGFLPIGATFDFLDQRKPSSDRYEKISPRKHQHLINSSIAAESVDKRVSHIELIPLPEFIKIRGNIIGYLKSNPRSPRDYIEKHKREKTPYSRNYFEDFLFKIFSSNIGENMESRHKYIIRSMIFDDITVYDELGNNYTHYFR